MKRLKIQCPFGGKTYPAIASAVVGFAALTFCSFNMNLPWDSTVLAMVLAVFVVLLLCYGWEQHLTPAEEEAIANAQYPLWEPVNEDIVDRVRSLKWFISLNGALAGCLFLFLGLITGLPNLVREGGFGISALLFLIGMIIITVDFFRCMLWRSIDETAVYTFIPIDHMYDVTHHHNDGDYTTSYLVFYLPDGKYVLRARAGSGDYGAIAVVKFHHMITWVSVPSTRYLEKPEDF